jgi:5-(carboxyamino)imidazole ribonucleotide mutase
MHNENPRAPIVGIVMGSKNDWPTLQPASELLTQFDVAHEVRVVSAHRTPELLHEYGLRARDRGLKMIIAGAGGAAHLPGMLAAITPIPVFGVPVKSSTFNGVDSLLSIICMPRGVPVATFAIGEAGAANAALSAIAVLALNDSGLAEKLDAFRAEQTRAVLAQGDPRANGSSAL